LAGLAGSYRISDILTIIFHLKKLMTICATGLRRNRVWIRVSDHPILCRIGGYRKRDDNFEES
jgi:hypothetical protein